MNIQVSKDRAEWLESLIKAGHVASLEDAIEAAVAALRAEFEQDDEWARPYIEEALQSIERGESKPWSLDETLKDLHARHPELVNGKAR